MEVIIDNILKSYDSKTVVDIPSLKVSSGDMVCISGEKGAGKTTLLRMILDLAKADRGSICIDGKDVNRTSGWKAHTGAFIDKGFLIPFYTPYEYFRMIADTYGTSRQVLSERLEQYKDMKIHSLTATNRQIRQLSEKDIFLTGLTGAMIVNPKLLILDNPLDNDSCIEYATAISEHMRSLNQHFGTTIIYTTDQELIPSKAGQKILAMHEGHIKELNIL